MTLALWLPLFCLFCNVVTGLLLLREFSRLRARRRALDKAIELLEAVDDAAEDLPS